MQEAASTTTVQEVIFALDEILTHETQALIRLDATAVEAAAQRKLELTESLAAFAQPFSNAEQLQLAKIRGKLRNNLILLAHAREHVKATVQIMTGRPPTFAPHQKYLSGSVRLDLRG
jgi:hypothetical protein